MTTYDLELNSRWYVQLAPRSSLVEREVIEVTELTVLLRDPYARSAYNTVRYRFSEIEFIEAC